MPADRMRGIGEATEYMDNYDNSENDLAEDQVYGIVKVDEQGRITLPKSACRDYDIQPGERLVVMRNEADELVLVKAELFSEE